MNRNIITSKLYCKSEVIDAMEKKAELGKEVQDCRGKKGKGGL